MHFFGIGLAATSVTITVGVIALIIAAERIVIAYRDQCETDAGAANSDL